MNNRFYTPLIYPAPWLQTWSDMNMSCLKQNNAADAVVLQSSKELPPKAAQIPRLTKESRLVGRAATCISILAQLCVSITLAKYILPTTSGLQVIEQPRLVRGAFVFLYEHVCRICSFLDAIATSRS